MSEKLKNIIKYYEKWRNRPYKDVGGWAIGYGNHYYEDGRPVQPGDGEIDEARGERILVAAINRVSEQVEKLVDKDVLTESQFEALVSLKYNCRGIDKNSTIIKTINKNPNDQNIKALFCEWRLSEGKVNEWLVRRRATEYKYYSTGEVDFKASGCGDSATKKSTPSSAVSNDSYLQTYYINTMYCLSVECDNGDDTTDDSNDSADAKPVSKETPVKKIIPKEWIDMSRAIYLTEIGLKYRCKYIAASQGGGYTLKITLYDSVPGEGVVDYWTLTLRIKPNPNRYETESQANDKDKKQVTDIVGSSKTYGKNYDECVKKFEDIFGKSVGAALYEYFSGARYERIGKKQMSRLIKKLGLRSPCDSGGVMTIMVERRIYMAYFPGGNLLPDAKNEKVALRCSEYGVVTFTVSGNTADSWEIMRLDRPKKEKK